MQLNPYLAFNGNCKQAFEFYAKQLGGKIEMMLTHRESPMAKEAPPEWQDKIMHASMTLDGHVLMGGDAPPNHYKQPQGFSVSVSIKKAKDAERIFQALAEKGQVQMPIQETFWAERFGMVTDRFGIPWMVNCEKPNNGSAH